MREILVDKSLIEDISTLENDFLKSASSIKFIPGFYIASSLGEIYYSHSDFEINLNSSVEIVDPSEFEEKILSSSFEGEIGSWLGEYDFDIWKNIFNRS